MCRYYQGCFNRSFSVNQLTNILRNKGCNCAYGCIGGIIREINGSLNTKKNGITYYHKYNLPSEYFYSSSGRLLDLKGNIVDINEIVDNFLNIP